MKTDFTALQSSLKTALDAKKSGNQDQVSFSEDALLKAVSQMQSDVASIQGTNGGAQTQPPQNSLSADLKSLGSDLQAVSDAKKSGNQDQIDSAENTLQQMMQQTQNDITGMKKGHHHHHKAQAAYGAANGNNDTSRTTPSVDLGKLLSQGAVGSVSMQA
jgi:hypothetical protein